MTTYKEIDIKLDKILGYIDVLKDDINSIRRQQERESAAQEILTKIGEKHERVLYGVNGNDGMVKEIGLLQQTVNALLQTHKENRATLVGLIILFIGQVAQWFIK